MRVQLAYTKPYDKHRRFEILAFNLEKINLFSAGKQEKKCTQKSVDSRTTAKQQWLFQTNLTRRPIHYNEFSLHCMADGQSCVMFLLFAFFLQGSSQRIRLFSIKNIQHPVTGELTLSNRPYFLLVITRRKCDSQAS